MDGLIAEHISKTYAGTHGLSFAALRDVSIRLEPGSFTSLVGESGSGKSTLARLLVGLEAPDQGAIFLDGEDTSGWSTEDWRKRRTKLQAVFQDASGTLNPMRSVRSNVEEAMVNLTSLSKRQRRERIGKLMELKNGYWRSPPGSYLAESNGGFPWCGPCRSGPSTSFWMRCSAVWI